jgi:hypothetical protein
MDSGKSPKLLACRTLATSNSGSVDVVAARIEPAVDVAEAAQGRREDRGGQQVRGHHPGGGGGRDAEVGLDVGEDRNDQGLQHRDRERISKAWRSGTAPPDSGSSWLWSAVPA